MIALAGMWVAWNTFLAGIVPGTIFLEIINNTFNGGGSGRRARRGRNLQNRHMKAEEIMRLLNMKPSSSLS